MRGGEGATKLVPITITGAATEADAWMAARAMANSPLVKTAVHGADPNWGRLVAATGRSGAAFVLDHARVRIGSLVLFDEGRPFDERAPLAAEYLQGTDLEIEVDLGTGGPFTATVWTCDLTAVSTHERLERGISDLNWRKDFLSILDLDARRAAGDCSTSPPGSSASARSGRPRRPLRPSPAVMSGCCSRSRRSGRG